MEEATMEPGKIINSTDLVISKTRTESREMVNGKKTKELSGLVPLTKQDKTR
jgi:hypothetical protein